MYQIILTMKRLSILVMMLSLFATGAFAQVTVDVFINGIKGGQYNIKANQADNGGISYKKSVYKKVDRLSIQIKGKSIDGGYTRKVEVMGDETAPIFVAAETEGAPGQFILSDKMVLKRLAKGKPITLYVEKTPANTKSKEAAKKVYIGKLTRS